MKKSNSTKKTEEIDKPLQYGCDFCGRTFARETTIGKHICEYKSRWLNKDLQSNRIGFQAWMQFYQKNTATKKKKTHEDFIKSAFYAAFVKFGAYCINVNAINISRFTDWLVKNQIKLDTWCSDTVYTRYLIEYLRTEDPLDGIARSVETTIEWSSKDNILPRDYLRYGNPNRICQLISVGKITPWMLYQSQSGVRFLETLNPESAKMIMDYINPEQWALKFHREPENVKQVKELLNAGGY
jgi:hypothetical protein